MFDIFGVVGVVGVTIAKRPNSYVINKNNNEKILK